MHRHKEQTNDTGSTTVIAMVLAVALVTGGGLLAIALQDPQAPVTKDASTPHARNDDVRAAAEGPASVQADPGDPTVNTINIDWEGRLATTACAPVGLHACFGTRIGEDDAYHETGVEGPLGAANLTLTWDASTPLMEELYLAVYSVRVECDGNCYYFGGGAQVQGTSPLHLHATDLEPAQGESLWIVVDSGSETPPPLYAQMETDQPFHVTGTLVPGGLQDGQEHA